MDAAAQVDMLAKRLDNDDLICILALPVFLFSSFSSRHAWIIFSASFVEIRGSLLVYQFNHSFWSSL